MVFSVSLQCLDVLVTDMLHGVTSPWRHTPASVYTIQWGSDVTSASLSITPSHGGRVSLQMTSLVGSANVIVTHHLVTTMQRWMNSRMTTNLETEECATTVKTTQLGGFVRPVLSCTTALLGHR